MKFHSKWSLGAAALTFLTLACLSSSSAATIHVPADQPTIQAGIDAAIPSDTVLVADGTYTGSGNRDIDFGGKGIVLRSVHGPEVTIIDCQGSSLNPHRGINFHNAEDTLSKVLGFKILNGFSENFSPSNFDQGGAVRCSTASPVIRNCVFSWNSSVRGGAIYCKNSSSPIIESCVFKNNFSNHYGGSLYTADDSDPSVIDCVFNDCASGAHGGSIVIVRSSPTLIKCVVSRPSAPQLGGAVFIQDGSIPLFQNCTFYGASGGSGSSFFIDQRLGQPSPTNPIINNCIIAFGSGSSAFSIKGNPNPSFQCTNIFGTPEGDWTSPILSQLSMNNNFSADPDFCDPVAEDFQIAVFSPCAAPFSPCGELVGALDVGCCCILPGDADNSGSINIRDATFIIAYLFSGGDAPSCLDEGDANGSNSINISDATYTIAYIFSGGAAPACGTTGT